MSAACLSSDDVAVALAVLAALVVICVITYSLGVLAGRRERAAELKERAVEGRR